MLAKVVTVLNEAAKAVKALTKLAEALTKLLVKLLALYGAYKALGL